MIEPTPAGTCHRTVMTAASMRAGPASPAAGPRLYSYCYLYTAARMFASLTSSDKSKAHNIYYNMMA